MLFLEEEGVDLQFFFLFSFMWKRYVTYTKIPGSHSSDLTNIYDCIAWDGVGRSFWSF